MAVKDVKNYYYTMQAQYLQLKEDLADFEQAFKDGHITEDRLEDVKFEVEQLQANYDRLRYVLYLLDLPNKTEKKKRVQKRNKKLEEEFDNLVASSRAVEEENKSILANITKELTDLTE